MANTRSLAQNAATMIDLHQRRSGVLAHITSLPGPHGIGDFGPGAYAFVDWMQSAGQRIWQWLPTTPVGPGDSPYQSVSAFAGSPLMVALEPLVQAGWLAGITLPEGGFNADIAEFECVTPWRMALLREAALTFEAHGKPAQHQAFNTWCDAQHEWLPDYAAFMTLETLHDGAPWWQWPPALRLRHPASLRAMAMGNLREYTFWRFVQWCFDTQLAALKAYANARNVLIVGDLPIFIAHHSADCWAAPEQFELDAQHQPTVVAGVPPDDFTPQGQRWGNPLYRWQVMADDGFAWWTRRVQRAMTQADIFRIDHFCGFGAYWEIPASAPGADQGRWVPAPGQALFEAITGALGRLPIIAEDLGNVTPEVIALRDGNGFPGMKILQEAFGGDGTHGFLPHNYTPHCVAYSGTHDGETARGWWDNASAAKRQYAGCYLGCDASNVHWAMIRALSNSVAHMAVFPLQDVMGLGNAQRMNQPGTMGGGNWRWRFTWPMLTAQHAYTLAAISVGSGRLVIPAPRPNPPTRRES
jgi:4-alpha-glucanotransferase